MAEVKILYVKNVMEAIGDSHIMVLNLKQQILYPMNLNRQMPTGKQQAESHQTKGDRMKEIIDLGKTILAFPFGFLAELFARIALFIQPDMDVDFNYLRKNKEKQI